MTREEHWKIVDAVIDAHKDNEMGGKYAKAFNHGVQSAFNRVCKALEDIEQQPNRCDNCIHSEEQDGSNCYECVKGMADNFEAQPCEGCISREAVIEHICEGKECYKEECKGRTLKRCPDLQWVFDLPSVTPKYTDEEIDKIQALEQAYVDKMVELAVEESRQKVKPSDCVNRAVVKLDMLKYGFSSSDMTVTEFADNLQPVTPQRPKGKWIEDTQTGFKIRCSKCGARNFGADRAYCPRCGRQMKEDNDD